MPELELFKVPPEPLTKGIYENFAKPIFGTARISSHLFT